MAGLEQLSAEQWSAAYSAAMLNATAAANSRSQPQFGSIAPSPSATSISSSPHHPPTSHSHHHRHHQQLQLLQTQQAQPEERTGLIKPEAASTQQAGNPYNLMTVGALLKIQNSGTTATGGAGAGDIGSAGVRNKPAGNNHVATFSGVKNGHGLSSQSNMVATVKGLSGTPSPPSVSATLTQHLRDPAAVGSSSHHALPSTPQVTSASGLVSKRPDPLQIRPGVNQVVDEPVGGVAAPATPASPYTGQQGWYYCMCYAIIAIITHLTSDSNHTLKQCGYIVNIVIICFVSAT